MISLHQAGRCDVEPTEADAGRGRIGWGLKGVADANVAGGGDVRRGVLDQVAAKRDRPILPLGALPVEDRDLAEDRPGAGGTSQPSVDVHVEAVERELAHPDR